MPSVITNAGRWLTWWAKNSAVLAAMRAATSGDSARARSRAPSSFAAFTATAMAGSIDATLMPSRSAAPASASRSSSPVIPKSLPASAT